MAEADFSWRKILSFFGVGILAFTAIVTLAGGIILITAKEPFNGVFTIISGLIDCGLVVYLYKDYQNKSLEARKAQEKETMEKITKKK